MTNAYVLTHTSRDGNGSDINEPYGVYSSREKAADAILFWIFDNQETAEECREKDCFGDVETYITKESIWRVHKMEVDFIV